MSPKIRVLLVDDDKGYLETISSFLCQEGYEVGTAPSSRSALRSLKESPFEIVFLDYDMPEMNGMKLLEEIRKVNAELPVVFITGYPGELDPTKINQLGVAGLFPKTDSLVKLKSLIQTVLRTHERLEP